MAIASLFLVGAVVQVLPHFKADVLIDIVRNAPDEKTMRDKLPAAMAASNGRLARFIFILGAFHAVLLIAAIFYRSESSEN